MYLLEYIRQTLSERKQVGVIYHFTISLERMLKIADTGMEGSEELAQKAQKVFKTIQTPDKSYSYSFTRNPWLTVFGDFRITIDGDKLSDKYKIQPVQEPAFTRQNKRPEFEERIISPYPKIDISKCILSMDVLVSNFGGGGESLYRSRISDYQKALIRKNRVHFLSRETHKKLRDI